MSKEITITNEGMPLATQFSSLGSFKTDQKAIKTRPGAGGKILRYVEGNYIIKQLNKIFGHYWDFEILDEKREGVDITVKGQLTIKAPVMDNNGVPHIIEVIKKTQFGSQKINLAKETKVPVEIGQDYKAAATDALKKCAMQLGIAIDLYSDDESEVAPVQAYRASRSPEPSGAMNPMTIDADTPQHELNQYEQRDDLATEPQRKKIFAMWHQLGMNVETAHSALLEELGLESLNDITKAQAKEVIEKLIDMASQNGQQ